MSRVLVIDSYDSFVYNLVQYLGELGAQPQVVRNDQVTVAEALAMEPDAVLLSPGPGRPEDAGILCEAITAFAEAGVPMLGVCLGHQAIGQVFGASVVRAPRRSVAPHGCHLSGTRRVAVFPAPFPGPRRRSEATNPGGPKPRGDRTESALDRGDVFLKVDAVGPGHLPEATKL